MLLKKMVVGLVATLLSLSSFADEIHLNVPIVAESPESALFYHEFLQKALSASGHEVRLNAREFPQARVNMSFLHSDIDIVWLLESEQRNKEFANIDIDLTNGLIGKRVLLIRKGEQAKFDDVTSLEEFRALRQVAGVGKDWFDAKVLQLNDLDYIEQSGNWRTIYRMLGSNRYYDYFPRGMNEIVDEAKRFPNLAIEQKLILQYKRDFHFYFSEHGEQYKDVIEAAIKLAQQSGLIDELVEKYWGDDFDELGMSERTVIKLQTPN
jgi:hypothetical protein